MKFLTVFVVALILATAQAVDWSNVRAVRRSFRANIPKKPLNDGRIIGGSQATPGQFPYQVGLFLDGSGFCGGSLISDTVIMTAAHCARGTRSFEAHLGAQNIYNEAEPGRVIVTSTDGVVHQQYNPSNLHNDIALVRLASPVSGATFGPVSLPRRAQEGETFEGVTARVSGWGRVSDSDPNISPELKFVDLTVVNNQVCTDTYGNIIVDTMICLDTNGGSEGTCNGDSGGPLVYQSRQIGIVSFGAAAGCEAGYPLGFTRVTSFLDWIAQNGGITIEP